MGARDLRDFLAVMTDEPGREGMRMQALIPVEDALCSAELLLQMFEFTATSPRCLVSNTLIQCFMLIIMHSCAFDHE